MQAHCHAYFHIHFFVFPLLYIGSLSLEIINNASNNLSDYLGESEFRSYFVFLALIIVQMLPSRVRDRLRVVLLKKNVK